MKFKKQTIEVEGLTNTLDGIRQFLEEREFYFEEKSEKWTESENGEVF